MSFFKKDFDDYDKLYHDEKNITKIKVLDIPKDIYIKSLNTKKQNLVNNILDKWYKVELYMIGLVFVILTGLVTNQLYNSSIISLKECLLSWFAFFVAHIFVVLSFGLLIIFAIELVKLFIKDTAIQPRKTILLAPVYLIPLFSQINYAMLNLSCHDNYLPQIGLSSLAIGIILIVYIFNNIEQISEKIKQIQSDDLTNLSYITNNIEEKLNNDNLNEM